MVPDQRLVLTKVKFRQKVANTLTRKLIGDCFGVRNVALPGEAEPASIWLLLCFQSVSDAKERGATPGDPWEHRSPKA